MRSSAARAPARPARTRPASRPHPPPAAPRPRSILYDLTELENAARIKKGETERTEKKVGNVMKWFAKLDSDLGNFLAYLS